MERKNRNISQLCAIMLAGILLLGCTRGIIPEQGALAKKEARILLPANGVKKGKMTMKDLVLDYTVDVDGRTLRFSADIQLDQSVLNSYDKVKYFRACIGFLDRDGSVQKTELISPLIPVYGPIPQPFKISWEGVMEGGITALAVNYFGILLGELPGVGGELDLYYFPYE